MSGEIGTPSRRTWRRPPPLVALLGPTAAGKTEISLALCERFGGEIVGADSRQIYRGMDIGTAKPTPSEQSRVPHHLVDIRQPNEVLTVAEYQRLAYETIDAIHGRGALPVLVGGTVLYVRAVIEGLRIPEVPPNPALRQELEDLLQRQGRTALYEMLRSKDPATADVIDANNPRRLIRALEIVITTGRSKTELEGAEPPPYAILKVGLCRSRERLHDRIDRRVDRMIELGLVEETKSLIASGYAESLPAMTSLGYREIAAYLRGESTLGEASRQIKLETHRYLRHQDTWLRKMNDVKCVDLDSPDGSTEVMQLVSRFLESKVA